MCLININSNCIVKIESVLQHLGNKQVPSLRHVFLFIHLLQECCEKIVTSPVADSFVK